MSVACPPSPDISGFRIDWNNDVHPTLSAGNGTLKYDLTLDLLISELDITEQEVYRLPAPLDLTGLNLVADLDRTDLIAADPRLRSLPLWESYEPVPASGEPATRDAADPRHRRCADACTRAFRAISSSTMSMPV